MHYPKTRRILTPYFPNQVDLTEYMEKHEFVFDAVLDEGVSNDEVQFIHLFFL